MEDMYGFYTTSGSTGGQAQYYYAEDKPLMSPAPDNLLLPPLEYQTLFYSGGAGSGSHHYHQQQQQRMVPSYDVVYGGSDMELPTVISEAAPEQGGEDTESVVKARIKSHPSYPRLLQAYIDCQKVGAPPEISALLEEIRNENDGAWNKRSGCCFGADPELDEFMETYIDMLVKYKSDLERPFDEATTFLNKIELQLSNLSTTASFSPDEGGGLSDEEFSGGETDVAEAQVRSEDRNLKDRLLREFGSHISSLKLEFSKKKKKGKLPKEARQTLLDWWNVHYKWPYPTEVDKNTLAQSTGLDQKQINNWFINQRKRHWKPSENMQLALMDNLPGQFFTDD